MSDTLVRYDTLGAAHVHGIVDLYAAMPSLHVAWAVWCAMAIIATSRSRRRWIACIYPLATSFVVVATANHYLLDVTAGALLAAIVVLAVGRRTAGRRRATRSAGHWPASINSSTASTDSSTGSN